METNLDEMIELLIAKKRGDRIEFFCEDDGTWIETHAETFNFCEYKYRVKPEEEKILLTTMELFELGATHIKTDNRIEVIAEFWGDNIRVATRLHEGISQLQERGAKWTADRKTWYDFYKRDFVQNNIERESFYEAKVKLGVY